MADASELAGKIALVTGGARNIGRAISCALAAGGASVMVNALHSRKEAEETVRIAVEKAAARKAREEAEAAARAEKMAQKNAQEAESSEE